MKSSQQTVQLVDEQAVELPTWGSDPNVDDAWPAERKAAAPAAERPRVSMPIFRRFNPAMAEKLVAMPQAEQHLIEQYRKLAATLHFAQAERGLKVLIVVSAVASEGKTLTAVNLALTLSEAYGRKVLLIDADLRRPSVHTVFDMPNIFGLQDHLTAETERMLSAIEVSPTLSVVLAGRCDSDPLNALTSDRMRRIVEHASSAFDWVIIDTPPVGLLSDARLLAAMADGALLVIGAGKTPYGLIQRAIEILGRSRIIGTVLNRVDVRAMGSGYYYSYEGYGYGRKT